MSAIFETTHWTIIFQASDAQSGTGKQSLDALCRAYWQPVYTWIRGAGRSHEDSQDLTQAFFQHLLKRELYADVHPSRGRFRSWLIALLKIFLASVRRSASAVKRGGPDLHTVQLDQAQDDLLDQTTPDLAYDKKWAHSVLANAMERLAADCEESGQSERLEVLKPLLFDSTKGEGATQEDADRLGLSLNATKVALTRLRQRYREMLRLEVSRLVANQSEIDDELAYLASVLRQQV